jgi:calcineurin-like phosphoesterase family protein
MSICWFTADWHFGHTKVLKFTDRPFASIAEHDAGLIARHNSVVNPDDDVWVCGDVALGDIERSLACCAEMNGKLHLVLGNHDRPAMARTPEKRDYWTRRYLDEGGFFEVIDDDNSVDVELPNGAIVLASHYPYSGDGDSFATDRFADRRPLDTGQWLVHGHVHKAWHVRGRQINVGVDVWEFQPAPWETIAAIAGLTMPCE